MKKLFRLSKRGYYRKIISFLILFSVLLYLPYSFIVYTIAQKNMSNSINSSNQFVLQQINHNYNSSVSSVKALANSLFWRKDVQQILYTPDLPYSQIYYTLQNIIDTVLASYPALHSICLYNKYDDKLYTLMTTGQIEEEEFKSFVADQKEIPVYQPILHTLTTRYYQTVSEKYIMTSFMYQFCDPCEGDSSYLAVNQFADQAIGNVDVFENAEQNLNPSVIFFLSNHHQISSSPLTSETQEIYNALLSNFESKKKQLDPAGNFYVDNIQGKKYLVSYFFAQNGVDSVLRIQDYNEVFSDLTALKNNLFFTFAILFFSSLLIALAISRGLYRPINSIVSFFSKGSNEISDVPQKVDELEYIKKIYINTNKEYSSLKNRESVYSPITLQYNLYSLLINCNAQSIAQFQKMQPLHWLSSSSDIPMCIILIEIDQDEKNRLQTSETSINLLLYAIQNISEELLSKNYLTALFKHNVNSIGFVLGRKNESQEEVQLMDILVNIRELILQHFEITITIAVSSEKLGIASLGNLFQETLTQLSYRFLLGSGIISKEQCAANERNKQIVYPSEFDIRLQNAINSRDIAQIKTVLDDIQATIMTFNSQNASICTFSLLNQIHKFLNEVFSETSHSRGSSDFNILYRDVLNSVSLSHCFDEILSYITTCLSDKDAAIISGNELFLSTVMEFVQNSYFDPNLSSQLIADHMGMNNRYLMKKFKSLTGITLNEHIITVRMKKATNLLRNTKDSISSIAEQVGITNTSYFYKLFKDYYGFTPREFADRS